jgi:hypothetical protein
MIRDCCQIPENLSEPESVTDDIVVRTCKECGARHYEAYAELLEVGAEGAET